MNSVIDHVQDVSEGDEIIEDGEDVLELAVVDELDESEIESNSQSNTQVVYYIFILNCQKLSANFFHFKSLMSNAP